VFNKIVKYIKTRKSNTVIAPNEISEIMIEKLGYKRYLIETGVYINDVLVKGTTAIATFTVDEFKEYETKLIDEIFNEYFPNSKTYTFVRRRIDDTTLVYCDDINLAFKIEKKIIQ
jgi:hypothetical protein